jgi:hypothetical protein
LFANISEEAPDVKRSLGEGKDTVPETRDEMVNIIGERERGKEEEINPFIHGDVSILI